MQEFIRPSILFACSLCFLTACSDETTQSNKKQEQITPATPDQAKVQKAISLKDLVIGKDVKKLKNAKNFSANAYMFNYDYFGEKRSFVANTNDKGEIYKYKTTFNGSLDELKTALEEKLTSENGTTVKTELLAGLTTFMTMAYILAVNPIILSATGMDLLKSL